MDNNVEALVGFVGSHGDALELLKLAKGDLDQMLPFVHLLVNDETLCRRGCWEITTLAPRSLRSAMMASLSKVLSVISTSKANPLMSGSMPTVSKRCPGSSSNKV